MVGVLPNVSNPHRAVFASDRRKQADRARWPPARLDLFRFHPDVDPDAERMRGITADSRSRQLRAGERLRLEGNRLQHDSGAVAGDMGEHLVDGRAITPGELPAPLDRAAAWRDARHGSSDDPGQNQCGRQNRCGWSRPP